MMADGIKFVPFINVICSVIRLKSSAYTTSSGMVVVIALAYECSYVSFGFSFVDSRSSH